VQINICSSVSKNSKNADTLLFSSPGVQRLYLGFGCQSVKNPNFFNSVVSNDAPIDFSGTATITFFIP